MILENNKSNLIPHIMIINIAARTDIGKEREQNEDAFILCPNLKHPDWDRSEARVDLGEYGVLLAVADGMGGANAGEVASGLAVETLKRCFSVPEISDVVVTEKQALNFLQRSIKTADEAIKEQMQKKPETMGMGTTIVVCWILKDKALIAWCGDSRCYVFNPKTGLRALTKDHSYVQELVDKGELTAEEAFSHPDSNIITRGLGDFDAENVPDIVSCPTRMGDVFMLCSDGLCGYCTNEDVEKTMRAHFSDVSGCCNALVKMALDAGGYDNICIAMASVGKENGNAHFASSIRDFLHKLFH